MVIREVKGDTFRLRCDDNGDLHIEDLTGMGICVTAEQGNELRQLLDHVWSANSLYRFTGEYKLHQPMGLTPVDNE